jgi:hypothetical protein
MRQLFLPTFLFCLLYSGLQAQNAWKPWQTMATKTNSAAGKTATHEDYPALAYQFIWHDSLVAWDSVYMETMSYSVNGDLSEVIGQQYIGNGFAPQRRSIYTYASPGFPSSETAFNWSGNSWMEDYRTETTYDSQSNVTQYLNFFWTGAAWDTSYGQRNTYSYVFTDKIASRMEEFWDSTSHQWNNSSLEQFTYPNATAWDTATLSLWDLGSWLPEERYVDVAWYDFEKGLAYAALNQGYGGSGWEDVARFRATFGAHDSQTIVWDEWSGNDWDSTTKDVIINDQHDHQTVNETYIWIGAWQQSNGYLSHYTYDAQDRTTEIIDEWFDGYIYRYADRHTYPSFFTGQNEPIALQINVNAYPNPCDDQLTFGLEHLPKGAVQIQLYDLSGRLRMNSAFGNARGTEITVPISETLENGTYIWKVSAKSGVATGKIILQH